MKNIQAFADKTAITLSFMCTIHCLALPIIIVMLPTMAALNLQDEAFHLWMLVAVLPISIFALTMGCKKHKDYRPLTTGIAGIIFLIAALVIGHDLFGEAGEKIFTVIGACLTAIGHYFNHRLCQHTNCECHAE